MEREKNCVQKKMESQTLLDTIKNGKRIKKFKPHTQPRYLYGEIGLAAIMLDLKVYNQHLKNIHYAKPQVDTKPPHMNPYQYLNLKKIQEDAKRVINIQNDNKNLVQRINTINRTKGVVDCWNTYKRKFGRHWILDSQKAETLMKENKHLHERIIKVKSEYSRSEYLKDWKKILERIYFSTKYHPLYTDKIRLFDDLVKEQPSISDGRLPAIERPKVYMNFEMEDGPPLGQIVIELFNDYAPQTVENFVAICNKENNLTYEKCRIHYGAKGSYFATGDITLGTGKGGATIFGNDFQKELSILKHSRIGVVSSVNINKQGFVNSQFRITFGPMPELDGEEAVFGKVIKGNKTLCKINDECKKHGRLLDQIIISRCGQINRVETEKSREDVDKEITCLCMNDMMENNSNQYSECTCMKNSIETYSKDTYESYQLSPSVVEIRPTSRSGICPGCGQEVSITDDDYSSSTQKNVECKCLYKNKAIDEIEYSKVSQSSSERTDTCPYSRKSSKSSQSNIRNPVSNTTTNRSLTSINETDSCKVRFCPYNV